MFTEDLAPFFSQAEFAVQAQAFDRHGVLQTFPVIFDAAYGAQLGGLVGDVSPMAVCKSADVADMDWSARLSLIVTDAAGTETARTAYTVATIQPDGTGMTTLTLREACP